MTTDLKDIIEKIKNPMVVISILAAFLLSLYIRTVLPHDSVFLGNGVISISEDDGVYQMRIVEWIVHNFPDFLWFDAYTLYPHGQAMPWAPFFTYSLAIIALIAGLGSPSLNTIYTVGAYYPAILGALVVIPTYYIAKNVFDDRRIGILSAFIIAIIPGQFLSRSLLGFTDHHIAETLLSTVTMLYLVLSVKVARKNSFTFSDIKSLNWSALKPSIYYFILTGLFLSLYALTWKGALLFAFFIGIYIMVQHIVDHMHNKPTEYLGVLGTIIFLIPLIIVIIVPDIGGEKNLYYVGLTVGIILFPILSGLSILLNKKGYEKYYYPLFLAIIIIGGLLLINVAIPPIFDTLKNSLTFFVREGGGQTIAEAGSYFERYGGSFTIEPFIRDFGNNAILSFIGLAFLAYGVFKKERQEKTVFLVWTIMMLWALFQQNRFAYYYAVNVAILSAYFGVAVADKVLESGGWNELLGKKSITRADKKKDIKKASKTHGSEALGPNGFAFKNIKVSHLISLLAALFLVAYLVYPLIGPAINYGENGRGMKTYWYESLTWMRYNTPDPGVDFYGKYQKPSAAENYSYPDSAYGVMSWWDYGHVITAWAHRIPNANPFQSGIGGGLTHVPGASTFLSAQSEEEANAVLDAIGVNGKPVARYVITDDYINFAAFGAVLEWAKVPYDGYYAMVKTNKGEQLVPYTKRYNAMMMRLQLFDGDGLKTYRLVHESVPAPTGDGNVGDMGEAGYKDIYNKLYGGNLPVEYTGHVKIFEHVKGARITGKAPQNATVSISLKVKTNQGREYSYSQKTVSNGEFELIVPYSTEGSISGETNFDTKPIGKYTLTAGNISREVSVNERMVLDGGTEKVDLV
ncbi:MAG: oligosaccharyl transferase, archaeosortase A system-associated [Candidatus Methanoperedenaceae archaeon]|nr:MAG: oligosaccharyl transferase, archaeosortase A system-associated [Candidatus Methanoperedenaceae archaeon]